jgi:hypothetical protein
MKEREPGQRAALDDFRHFTDRLGERALFERCLDRPAGEPPPVLMFFGVGGIGKSWLTRHLRRRLGDPPRVRSARLDLDPDTGGARYLSDPASALVEIRVQLGVECPRFDLAFAMMRHKQSAGEEPLFRGGGALSKAFNLATGVATAVANHPIGSVIGAIVETFAPSVGKKATRSPLVEWVQSRIGQQDLLDLRRLDAQDIQGQLFERLGLDLEAGLPKVAGKACAAVVFLDTFEAIRGGLGGESQAHERERWVRRLYECSTNVLLVLSGQHRLTWDEHDPDWADPRHLIQHLLGGLSRPDAAHYLEQREIPPGPLREAILRASLDLEHPGGHGEASYHPYCLGVCADAVARDRASNVEPEPATFAIPPGDLGAVADRFLKSLHDAHLEQWMLTLALTPRFDEPAGRAAFSPTPGAPRDAAWEALEGFSFLRAIPEPGWFALHPRMRHALIHRLAREPDDLRARHTLWRDHWQGRSQHDLDPAAALAWHHTWSLDPEEGRASWNRRAESARRERRMTDHLNLLEWWKTVGLEEPHGPIAPDEGAALNDLGVELSEATLGHRGENLRRAIERYTAALRVYTEADFPEWFAGTCWNRSLASLELAELTQETAWLGSALADRRAAARGYAAVGLDQEAERMSEAAEEIEAALSEASGDEAYDEDEG